MLFPFLNCHVGCSFPHKESQPTSLAEGILTPQSRAPRFSLRVKRGELDGFLLCHKSLHRENVLIRAEILQALETFQPGDCDFPD
jgi:hypothetical protein